MIELCLYLVLFVDSCLQLFTVDTRLADYNKSEFGQIKLNWIGEMTI